MKNRLLLFVITIISFGANSQMDVNLKLNHYWNGDVFNYNQNYTDHDGNTIVITRVQYYLTGFNLTHDGGQTTSLGDTVILASGNITDYELCNANITSLEGIDFDLGVDANRNHLDPNTYDTPHPLALQSPSMHWGWSAGYNFLVINGKADTDNDQVPDATFEFHVTSDDNYLRNVLPINTSGTINGSVMDIDVDVNVADWLITLDLKTAGSNHGAWPRNETVMDNTNDYTVFTDDIGLSVTESEKKMSSVYFDYTLAYAPTIYYKFPSAETVSLTITDINGRVLISENNLSKADNYFIQKELATGTYLAVFKTDNDVLRSEKFVVTQ
jgi:hypothetical protein